MYRLKVYLGISLVIGVIGALAWNVFSAIGIGRQFLIFCAGGAAYLAWLGLWAVVLRSFGIPVHKENPEARALVHERFLRMSERNFIVIVGVLRSGFSFGLGAVIIIVGATHPPSNWTPAFWAFIVAMWLVVSIYIGLDEGYKDWHNLVHNQVSSPPVTP